MEKDKVFIRDLIAAAIRSVADEIVKDHYSSITQEPDLTARIAQGIEQKLDQKMNLNGYKISVITQTIPDRGPGALEKKIGTDLYLGINVEGGGYHLSKGFFVQAKWLTLLNKKERKKLSDQCSDMLNHTTANSAFVWSYGSNGISVVPASEIVANPELSPSEINSRNLDELFRDVLDCFLGDKNLVHKGIFTDRRMLSKFLEEFRVKDGVSISLVKK